MKYILKDNQNQFFFSWEKSISYHAGLKKKLKKIDRINLLHVSNYDTLTKRNQILIYLFFLLERNTPRMAEYQTVVLEEEKKSTRNDVAINK